MRIIARKVPEKIVEVEIFSQSGTLNVTCSLARSKRCGFRKHELGLEFIDLTPETEAEIREIARCHRMVRSM